MENWFDVITPHKDIVEGNFDESQFAADLGDVATRTASIDYNDPYIFFQKTYLTSGLKDLLISVRDRLLKGKGNGVVQIQTPFGGGKTHALVSVYHLVNNSDKIKAKDAFLKDDIKAKSAVIVGTHLNPLKGRKVGKTEIKTIWGEIAYQIGGEEGFRLFAENDAKRIPPGKEELKNFFQKNQPFVILMDEILQYITKAAGVKVGKENLASLTLAFCLELTGAVSGSRNGLILATLPSSSIEDVSEANEEYLLKISKIFGREEIIVTPVQGEEIYSVIRKRLFEKIDDEKKLQKIINDYFKLYQEKQTELPEKVKDINYRAKLEKSYPFHPEVIDTLYEKWGTFTTLQRTRGILRFLSLVIGNLYQKEKNIDFILPADIDLGKSEIRRELIKHIGNEYDSIISSDIAGSGGKSRLMDEQNKTYKHLTEGISTSIFFHSFSSDVSERGVTLPYIKLATLRPEIVSALVTEILRNLEEKLWFLNVRSNAYYFSNIPNLNRMILDKKELHNDDSEDKVKDVIRDNCGSDIKTFMWPYSSDDIGDNPELKLVLLGLDFKIDDIKEFVEKKGNMFRQYKNTLIFASVDTSSFSAFKEQMKIYLALNDILQEIKSGSNKLLKDKVDEIQDRIKNIEKDFSFNARKIYKKLRVNNKEIDLGQPIIGKEHISAWIRRELIEREIILTNMHYRVIVNKYLSSLNKVKTKGLQESLYKSERSFIIDSPEVLTKAIIKGVAEGAFGVGFIKEDKIEGLKFNVAIDESDISYEDDEYIISSSICKKEKVRQEQEEKGIGVGVEGQTGKEEEKEKGKEEEEIVTGPIKRYKNVLIKVKNVSATKLFDFSNGVIKPISNEIGDFKMTIEIDISSEKGISQSTIETKVKETLMQIGAEIEEEKME
jgi:hypothetical protein